MTAIAEHVAAALRSLAGQVTRPGWPGVLATLAVLGLTLAFATDMILGVVTLVRRCAARRRAADARHRVTTR